MTLIRTPLLKHPWQLLRITVALLYLTSIINVLRGLIVTPTVRSSGCFQNASDFVFYCSTRQLLPYLFHRLLMDPARASRLNAFLERCLRNSSELGSSRQAAHFLEALGLFPNGVKISERLLSSKDGILCLQTSITRDLSRSFYVQHTHTVLSLLRRDQALSGLDDGRVLKQMVVAIIEASFFWSRIVTFLPADALADDETSTNVSWLLFHAVSLGALPENTSRTELLDRLKVSVVPETRTWAYHADQVLSLRGDEDYDPNGPGGRHDNDFRDIKEISILPTKLELLSDQPPFLRTALELHDSKTSAVAVDRNHLDNMFRLLREDMLAELKEEIGRLSANSKHIARSFYLRGLSIHDIQCSTALDRETGPSKWASWSVVLKYHSRLPGLSHTQSETARAKSLATYGKPEFQIMPREALVAIMLGNDLLGFGHVQRDPARMAKEEAEIPIRLDPGSVRPILAMTGIDGGQLSLLQVNTAVFAYEPFLRKLQSMSVVPMSHHLLRWSGREATTDAMPDATDPLHDLVTSREDDDVGQSFGIEKRVTLDESQKQAVLAGLTQAVTLIQGPPGMYMISESPINSLACR